MFDIVVSNLGKRFDRNWVFKGLSFDIKFGNPFIICGSNGSGKSTLLKLIYKSLSPDRGSITFYRRETDANQLVEKPFKYVKTHIGFVTQDSNLYSDMTSFENLLFFGKALGIDCSEDKIINSIKQFDLPIRKKQPIKFYSSGMKVRLKYSLLHFLKPEIVLIDEPTTNLDSNGKSIVYSYLEEVKDRSTLVIATNEQDEQRIGENCIDLDKL